MKLHTLLIICCLLLFTLSSSGQSINFFAGPSINRLADINLTRRSYTSDYTNGFGYQVGYGILAKTEDSLIVGAAIRLNHYGGGFTNNRNYSDAQSVINGTYRKTNISVSAGFQPFLIRKKIELFLEGEWSFRLHTKMSGYKADWWNGALISSTPLDKRDHRKFMVFGMACYAAYPFYHKNNTTFLLQYRLSYGLTNEMNHLGTGMKLLSTSLSLVARKHVPQ